MARAGAEIVVIVTGLRVATEMTLGTVTFGLLVTVGIWWRTGDFSLVIYPRPLLEQLAIYAITFGGLFAAMWLVTRQRIELNADTQELRVASINTGYRWRTLRAGDIARVGYHSHSKSLGQLLLSGSLGTRALAILEDSMFATGPSRFVKKIAGFVREHNPNAEISAVLTD